MRLAVDEERVAASALPALMAGDSLAPDLVLELVAAIASGMPGSQSARLAADLAHTLVAETKALRAELVAQSERLTAASRSYAWGDSVVRSLPRELAAAFGERL